MKMSGEGEDLISGKGHFVEMQHRRMEPECIIIRVAEKEFCSWMNLYYRFARNFMIEQGIHKT